MTTATTTVLSGQERKINEGDRRAERIKKSRIGGMMQGFRDLPPRIEINRARLFTESMKETEGLPATLRWAKALYKICDEIPVGIRPGELLVGGVGILDRRWGLLYPETRAGWMSTGLRNRITDKQDKVYCTEEDLKVMDEICEYWKGRDITSILHKVTPPETMRYLYPSDPYGAATLAYIDFTSSGFHNWQIDFKKAIERGLGDIRREAQEKINNVNPLVAGRDIAERLPFYQAVVIACDAVIRFAQRHAELARKMAAKEKDPQRKKELLQIAENCERVPEKPAQTFWQAIQSQWFTNLCSRFEQLDAGNVGNGRLDQYLYPLFAKDKSQGILTDESALELLENFWLKLAEAYLFNAYNETEAIQGIHFDFTTVGGQTRDGRDATNELTYLMVQSKIDFPLDFPDLGVRLHSGTPEPLMRKITELIKEGTGFPKMLIDDDIIPITVKRGATLEGARDYCGSGCIEARVLNEENYPGGPFFASVAGVLELTLNNGKWRALKNMQLGPQTGDPRTFKTFDDLLVAFRKQYAHCLKHLYIRQTLDDAIRAEAMGAPLHSMLHTPCMEQGYDLHSYKLKGGIRGHNTQMETVASAADSLEAIKHLIFDTKKVTWDQMLDALDKDWEGQEPLRQMCLNAPKYGNDDDEADAMYRRTEAMAFELNDKYRGILGGYQTHTQIPFATHAALGSITGALPNGRKAWEALSEGSGPCQGMDHKGPTAALRSYWKARNRDYLSGGARLMNQKFSPSTLVGEEGTTKLVDYMRTCVDNKMWHIQFNVVNRSTLIDAQKHPEKYRDLVIRVAGYSAYWVELSPRLQAEIIKRTEQEFE